ncbi:DUF4292 domain-containing protein [Pontibacter sp. 172403-2]|uniref:DUF4292 domain-containing protein n=1 Tax=Pontibacter rufus TaxID=2791028 RepID=UPI0018AFE653|nr:DUF4292 domain-containing protein [Pontibacter sp. 172403-2]MBF9253519.1 DUF4292 domain-containing protein [Pontibacter sp. 172403-2]
MSKYLLGCLLAVLLLAGCKKEVIPATASVNTKTIGKVTVNNLDFNYLTAKSQISLSNKGNQLTSGLSLRMKKDSVIWVSVQPGLGIEAARMMLTQDSVYIMDRLKREYTVAGYTFLRNKFQVDVSFEVLQALLLGNYQAQGEEKVIDAEGMQHVQQMRQNLLFDYFIGLQNNKLQRLDVQDKNTGNTIAVKYNDFQEVGSVPFAYTLAAQVLQQGGTSSFTLNHSKVTVTDEILSFPFSIPDGYTRLALN